MKVKQDNAMGNKWGGKILNISIIWPGRRGGGE